MTLRVLVACSPGERRVAVVEDDVLIEYALDRPGMPDGVGDLHRARIGTVAPAMAGAFAVLTDAEGFLPDSEGAKGRSEGETVGVRVIRAAQGGKGPRLTARLTPAEAARVDAGSPALLLRGPNAAQRMAARYPDAEVVIDDAAVLVALRPELGRRAALVGAAFDAGIEDAVAALEEADVALPSGGRLSIHPTPALVAIDVDLGAGAGERAGKTARHVSANQAAFPELVRQIRLRALSGAILVDLAGLSARRRASLAPLLAAALAVDPGGARLLGFTALGLAEIVRPRVHPPLHELLNGPVAVGLAALRRIARDLAADPARAPATLRAAPTVVAALMRDPVALPEFARRSGHVLQLRSDPSLPATTWHCEAVGD